MQGKTVAITGVLGGLGHRLAMKLLEQGANVLGIDNADPGAASPLHTAWQLDQLKRHEAFHFSALDIRTLCGQDLLVDAAPVDILVNCAAVTPFRRALTPVGLVEEIHHDAVLRLTREASDLGISRCLLLQYIPMQEEDPRKQDTHWCALLDAEARVRNVFEAMDGVLCLPLPTLVGFGQSLRTPPIAQYLQALSRVPVSMPEEDKNVAVSSMTQVVEQLLLLCNLDNMDFLYKSRDQLTISSLPLSHIFKALLDASQIEVEATTHDFPVWSGIHDSELPPADLASLVREISEWLEMLPHIPPTDWPDVPAKERRIMRSKRRRAKRNRESDS